MFTHLHGHSHYSLLEAIGNPKNIVREAKDLWMKAIALTDYNGLFWAIEFYKAAKDAEIQPIIWVEVWYVHDLHHKAKLEDIWNIVLLAKNYSWYKQLLKIVSEANLKGWHEDKARIDANLLKEFSNDLYLLIWWMNSSFAKMILRNEDDLKIKEDLQDLIHIMWKENIIIELTIQDESSFPQVKKINKYSEKLASEMEIVLTCSNNFHYIDQADQKVSEVALAIKDWKRMFDEDRRKVSLQQHIMSEIEIKEIATNNWWDSTTIDLMINNTSVITDSIDIELPLWKILFPKYESPEHIKLLYNQNKDILIEE